MGFKKKTHYHSGNKSLNIKLLSYFAPSTYLILYTNHVVLINIFQNDVTCKMSGANLMDHEVVLGVDTTVTLRELEAGSGARKITSSKNSKQSAKFETPKFMQLVEEMVRKNASEVCVE